MKSNIDEALERLRGTGPEVSGGGNPNHGPMAAEALVALGRKEAVLKWVDRYKQKLGPMPEASSPVTNETWREALGASERIGDWAAYFRAELVEIPWQVVFTEWVPRLIPGTIAAGTHGLIRTAHAIRALTEAETPLRVDELGVALAYWAAYYRELPGVPHLAGTLDFGQALDRIPRVTHGLEPGGMPREFVHIIHSHPGFPAAVDAAAAPESVGTALSTLTEAGARLYLANASHHPLVFIHTVTGPAALRLLLPYLPAALQETAFAYVWQAVAAWVAAYGSDAAGYLDDEIPATSQSEIVERSISTGDPHAIKFVEACVREFHLNPKPVYLSAAFDWTTRLQLSRDWNIAQRVAAGIEVG